MALVWTSLEREPRQASVVDALGVLHVFQAPAAELGAHAADGVDALPGEVEHATGAGAGGPELAVVVHHPTLVVPLGLEQIGQMVLAGGDVGRVPVVGDRIAVVIEQEQVLGTGFHQFGQAAVLGPGDAAGDVVANHADPLHRGDWNLAAVVDHHEDRVLGLVLDQRSNGPVQQGPSVSRGDSHADSGHQSSQNRTCQTEVFTERLAVVFFDVLLSRSSSNWSMRAVHPLMSAWFPVSLARASAAAAMWS